MVAEFRGRRDAFCAGLNSLPGFKCPIPEGAFYAFPDITGTGRSSKELADALLYDAGVACLSGASFGKWGEGYIRFSYANSLSSLSSNSYGGFEIDIGFDAIDVLTALPEQGVGGQPQVRHEHTFRCRFDLGVRRQMADQMHLVEQFRSPPFDGPIVGVQSQAG